MSTDVPLDVSVSITFSEYMNSSSAQSAFSLSNGVSDVPGTFSWSGTTMIFDPSVDLSASTVYQVQLGTYAKDASGTSMSGPFNSSFRTVPDTIPPGITSVNPVHLAGGVLPDANIVIAFSELMDKASVQSAFSLSEGTFVLAGTISWSGSVMTFAPSSYLSRDTPYTLTIGSTAQDLAGNTMAREFNSSFATIATTTAMAAGSHHTVALLADGTVKAWGNNWFGQLGNGTTTYRSPPVTVSGITNAVAIAAGYWHTVAALSDGTVKAWGSNAYGQLGDGTTSNRSTPVPVSGITNAIAVAVGNYHSVALLSDGTVKAWGGNYVWPIGRWDYHQSHVLPSR